MNKRKYDLEEIFDYIRETVANHVELQQDYLRSVEMRKLVHRDLDGDFHYDGFEINVQFSPWLYEDKENLIKIKFLKNVNGQ